MIRNPSGRDSFVVYSQNHNNHRNQKFGFISAKYGEMNHDFHVLYCVFLWFHSLVFIA